MKSKKEIPNRTEIVSAIIRALELSHKNLQTAKELIERGGLVPAFNHFTFGCEELGKIFIYIDFFRKPENERIAEWPSTRKTLSDHGEKIEALISGFLNVKESKIRYIQFQSEIRTTLPEFVEFIEWLSSKANSKKIGKLVEELRMKENYSNFRPFVFSTFPEAKKFFTTSNVLLMTVLLEPVVKFFVDLIRASGALGDQITKMIEEDSSESFQVVAASINRLLPALLYKVIEVCKSHPEFDKENPNLENLKDVALKSTDAYSATFFKSVIRLASSPTDEEIQMLALPSQRHLPELELQKQSR